MKRMLKILLCVGLLLSCIGCGKDSTKPDIDVTVEDANSFVTKEFEFYSDDEHIILYNFPDTYMLNGKEYTLSDEEAAYETLGTRDTVSYMVEMNVEDLSEIPDSYSYTSESGETYELKNEQVYIREQGMVTIPVVEEIYFEDQIGKPDVPSKKMITYFDKASGTDKEIEGSLISYEQTRAGHWSDILEIEGTFMAPSESCHVYELAGTPNVRVARNAAAPTWAGYESQVLSALGLDANYFRVTGASWSGEQYVQDGYIMRNALFTGDMFVSTYRARYEASREAEGYATNVYYRVDAKDVDAKAEDIKTVYRIKAIVKYKLME